MFRKTIEPVEMTDDEKIGWLASSMPYDLFPTAFGNDNELTLIALLARRIVELEKKCPSSP